MAKSTKMAVASYALFRFLLSEEPLGQTRAALAYMARLTTLKVLTPEAFYTSKSKGMGIGLFISRTIVERHRGRLWAEPNEGHGAPCSFSIPHDL